MLSWRSRVAGQGEVSSSEPEFAPLCAWGGDSAWEMACAVQVDQAVCDASL